jgi:hypothetical protein
MVFTPLQVIVGKDIQDKLQFSIALGPEAYIQ